MVNDNLLLIGNVELKKNFIGIIKDWGTGVNYPP
jgi:hypothetical protein